MRDPANSNPTSLDAKFLRLMVNARSMDRQNREIAKFLC